MMGLTAGVRLRAVLQARVDNRDQGRCGNVYSVPPPITPGEPTGR